MAAWKGHTKCCEYLIKGSVSPTTKSHLAETSLIVAFRASGQSDTVRLLLENGPDTLATECGATPRSPLHWVCSSGDVDAAKALFEFGAAKSMFDLNEEGLPPLALPAYYDHAELVKLLPDHGAGPTISIAGDHGYTILHLLTISGANDEIMRLLLGSCTKSCLSMVSDDENTPLHDASYSGHTNIVRLILENKTQSVQLLLEARGNYLQTSLFCATLSGHYDIVEELVKNGAETTLAIPEVDGYTPLCIASCLGHGEIVETLLTCGAAATVAIAANNGTTPLFMASTNGHTRILKQLLAHGAETTVACKTQGGDTALLAAIYKGRTEIVEMLLSHGFQNAVVIPDSGGATPLAVACLFRFVEIARLLLDYGAETAITLADNNQRTPLFEACRSISIEVVKLLLENGAETTIENLNSNDDSPLHPATFGGCYDMVLKLFAHGAGASLLVANKQGMTTLYIAAGMDEAQLMELYLDILKTVDQDQMNQKTYYGMTPLFIAPRFGHLEVVKLLISTSYIDLNCENWMGLTPLVTTVANGHLEVARLLISRGATVSPWVPIGQSLIWWARRTSNEDLVQLVESQDTAADVSLFDAHTRFEEPPCDATQVSFETKATWCCICTLSITDGQVYTCEECEHYMNSHVCSKCFDRGFRLCQSSHALILRYEELSWNVLMI
ncbi:Ff.00g129130.m01.CDS01 [Fusarium sp. VM40]|nr:Ff.00g129130.m01.CDS01 [Fusarium sp. VM40]